MLTATEVQELKSSLHSVLHNGELSQMEVIWLVARLIKEILND